ncbi:replicative DNA helicase [Acidiferrobacter sp.]|uniref:replicative DNA helicase n=1 Tax=Acidiferrobacter sp. TaxID=1872107 RepID=UPI00262C554C|nr:replicative DNA helicase [Acidiferrobacter sp.]
MTDKTAGAPRARGDAGSRMRLAPQSLEAEQAVLGGLLLDAGAWDRIADRISEIDFYRREHQIIFAAVAVLHGEGRPVDIVTVSERLGAGPLESVGGLSYLGALAENTPSANNIQAYADIVRERALVRRLIEVVNDIGDKAYQPEGRSAAELLDYAERGVFAITESGSRRGGFRPLKTLLTAAVDRIDALFRSNSTITGVATGFADLDNMTSGLQPGDLVIVAGRPSMGKTAFALNIAENAAVGLKLPVAIFSLEMPGEQLAMRLMSSLGRINAHRLRTGKLEDEDWPRLTSAVGMLAEASVYIDDTPALTPLELRARSRRLMREQGLGLIVVDYLQLMQASENTENRATEISGITRALKALAKELNVPLIALSQLNRSLEQRPNKRPVMSDLRESGAIEQDADVIFFIYRDEVYNEDSEDKGIAEIIIGKQRNGPIGKTRLTYLGEYTRFENHADAHAYDGPYA